MQFTAKLSTEHDGFVHAVNPVETRRPQTAHELLEALIWIEECQSKGLYVGGFFTYEAAIAFDDCHAVHRGPLPLAVLASYREVSTIELEDLPQGHMPAKFSLQPRIDKETYEKNLQKTLRYIKEGDIYQANLSFRCDIGMAGDSYETFCALYQRHPVPYAAYCNDHEIKVCSLSPELFVSRRGNHIISDPMKGTCPRGLSYNDDKQRQQQLADDTKTRS